MEHANKHKKVSIFFPSFSQTNILFTFHLLKASDSIHLSLILLAGIMPAN
jgi:hypothetical protein